MFVDRFFEVPIKIYKTQNERDENLGMYRYQEWMPAKAKLLPLQIESYREGIESELAFVEGNKKCVTVYMKSGDSYIVLWPMAEFEKRLNKFEEEVIT